LLKQSSASLKQHLQEKEEVIKSLKTTTETLQDLVQSKTNEINLLKKEVQRLSNFEKEVKNQKGGHYK
jgi:predicted RNase H-like nuclease (RuvC/YqgF family)